MYFDDEEQLPPLIPIKKKKNQHFTSEVQNISNPKAQADLFNALGAEINRNAKNALLHQEEDKKQTVVKEAKNPLSYDKVQEFEKKFNKNINENHVAKEKSIAANNKDKENQKSKYLVQEMLNKISIKNISEELYPVTNETIEHLIKQLDKQIDQQKIEAERKENSLFSNPNNQHLKKQLETMKTSIDRCVTIKQLYHEKTNLRNKVSTLEKNLIDMKQENQNLKIKINRGVETIERHMHNLPCEREKELKEELNKCQVELKKEKQMRIDLEGNVSDIILNFKRLYEEADTARLIVTRKLKEIQERERKISEPTHDEQEKQFEKRSPLFAEVAEERKAKKLYTGENSMADHSKSSKKNPQIQETGQSGKTKKDDKYAASFNMEEQIKKMRNNQNTISKANYK